MHTNNKWNILSLDQNYRSWFKALERVNPITRVPISNQISNTTYHNTNQLNIIKNGFCPCHFHSPDFLKFTLNINNNLFRSGKGTHLSSTSMTTIQAQHLIYNKYFKWRRLQFKGMRKVYLFTSIVGFKYIARNKASNGAYEILCGDLNTKEILKLEIFLVAPKGPCPKKE